MTATVTNNSWQNYRVGALVRLADGREFSITRVETRETEKGRQTRLFHLLGPNGERVVKTSRGLSLWANGGSSSAVQESGHANSTTVVNSDSEVVEAVRDHYAAATGGKSLAEIIAEAVRDTGLVTAEANPAVDRDEVAAIVDERLKAALLPQRFEVVLPNGDVHSVGVQHVNFTALLTVAACRENAWLVGPAGSSKTTSASNAAKALGLPFYEKSIGQQTSQAELLGYYDAQGRVVRTPLREAFENGGVFLLDEVDKASPGVLSVLNAVLANGSAGFPDGSIKKHPDFIVIAGANTYGQGADRQYVGSVQADAATLDRFAFLEWDNDPTIEAAKCGIPAEWLADLPKPRTYDRLDVSDAKAVEARLEKYVRKVVGIRLAIGRLGKGVRVLVGPRANIIGTALIKAGLSVEDALDICVWKGCDKDTRTKIEANVA